MSDFQTEVITYNRIEGMHFWEGALKEVFYLKNPHRHNFAIRTWFPVSHMDREVEIIMTEHEIEEFISSKYGAPACFNNMSCEMIARDILEHFSNASMCEVLEDGEGGAIVRKCK